MTLRHPRGERRELGTHQRRHEIELAAGGDLRMAGQHLLGQGRAGAEHPADEDRTRTARRRRGPRPGTGKRRDQLVDQGLLPRTVVEHDSGRSAGAARAVRRFVGRERAIVGGARVQQPPEGESEARPVLRRRVRIGDCGVEAADQRILG